MNTSVKPEMTYDNGTYYFVKWIKFKAPADNLTDSSGILQVPSGAGAPVDYSESSDISFTSAFDYNDGDGDYVYAALYKLVQENDPTVRVEVTYSFEDYDTSDGNYIYDENDAAAPQTYTKTIKVTDYDFAQTAANIDSIVSTNAPYIKSNYYDYSYTSGSAEIKTTKASESKYTVTASFTKTARDYTIIVKNGSEVVTTKTGNYQQTVELTAPSSISNPVWKIANGKTGNDQIIGSGSTYTARFVATGYEKIGSTDCQIIKVQAGSADATAHTSVVANSTTTVENNGATEILHHNFYIVDYCVEGELIGGGVLFATTDSSGDYRQDSAQDNLDTSAHRLAFINSILSNPYDVEYKAQSIQNIGFRYKPFKDTEDIFRYSDDVGAYLTVYEGTNVNSTNYQGQKLRLFSFMVYKTGSTYTVVVSDGYGEVDRYINTSEI